MLRQCNVCGYLSVNPECKHCGNKTDFTYTIYDSSTILYEDLVAGRSRWANDVFSGIAKYSVQQVAIMLFNNADYTACQYATWLQQEVRSHKYSATRREFIPWNKQKVEESELEIHRLLTSYENKIIHVYMQQSVFHTETRMYNLFITQLNKTTVTFQVNYTDCCSNGNYFHDKLGETSVKLMSKSTLSSVLKEAIMTLNAAYVINPDFLIVE